MPYIIKFISGAALGFDKPSICHSGKPKRTRCYAVAREPGREGWMLVQNPPSESRRDGWWCPDCARQPRQLDKRGATVASGIIPVAPPGGHDDEKREEQHQQTESLLGLRQAISRLGKPGAPNQQRHLLRRLQPAGHCAAPRRRTAPRERLDG